jgi:hypothetical protein
MRQISLGLLNYESAFKVLPSGWNTHGTFWSAAILPQIEQGSLYGTLVFTEAANWDIVGSPNYQACQTQISTYRCPSGIYLNPAAYNGIENRSPVSYRANGGNRVSSDDASTRTIAGTQSFEEVSLNGVMHGCSRIRLADIIDGLSRTVLIGGSVPGPGPVVGAPVVSPTVSLLSGSLGLVVDGVVRGGEKQSSATALSQRSVVAGSFQLSSSPLLETIDSAVQATSKEVEEAVDDLFARSLNKLLGIQLK